VVFRIIVWHGSDVFTWGLFAVPLRIVLVAPVIPQNTGSIARLTAATRSELHLIEPLGFELSDYYLRRAGLDYWPEVNLRVHADWKSFLAASDGCPLWFFSTHAEKSYTGVAYGASDYLVFGSETKGLAPEFHECYRERMLRIPMDNPNVRSLNLSASASVVLYEARRQLGMC
jgi:tRNA (cytidine/uridine-2'-O-)-methyltransferase